MIANCGGVFVVVVVVVAVSIRAFSFFPSSAHVFFPLFAPVRGP